MNPFAETWVRAIKGECLDHFMVFGEEHLKYLIDEYVVHYNEERPHQGLGNRRPTEAEPPPELVLGSGTPQTRSPKLQGLAQNRRPYHGPRVTGIYVQPTFCRVVGPCDGHCLPSPAAPASSCWALPCPRASRQSTPTVR